MGRHYSTREFFRQMPNALLARYFEAQGVLAEVDFGALKETQPDALFESWRVLPDDRQAAMDSEFREIFALSCEKGFRAIIDEADYQLGGTPAARDALVEHLGGLANDYERAMVTFLDHRKFWNAALLFYQADCLSYWRKRKNLPRVEPAVDRQSLQDLAGAISSYFHRTEGRGKHCMVEPLLRRGLHYFFAYPEDYSQNSVEWVKGTFARRPHNPAFEVIFVYSPREASLDLYCRGAFKAVEPLQRIFSEIILKTPDLPPSPPDERVYDLDALRERNFEFVYDPSDGIHDVRVKKLRLTSMVKKGDRVTIEANAANARHAVYDLLETVAASLPLRLYHVTQVEIAARVSVNTNKPPKSVTVTITYPNSCSLKYDDADVKLRRMLSDSGIQLVEQAELDQSVALTEVLDA